MTSVHTTFYSYGYFTSGFALIASLILQGFLLSLLGIWCCWIPPSQPAGKQPTWVFLETRVPARNPVSEEHSLISSSMRTAADKAARTRRYIDNIIHSLPEQPRPEPPRKPSPPSKPRHWKPLSKAISQPPRQAPPLPVPLTEIPTEPLPEASRNNAPLSDLLDTLRRRNPGTSAPANPPNKPSQEGTASVAPGTSQPIPAKEIATYLQLVRRRLEAAKTYPANARQRGQSGIVTLRFRIDAGGSVSGLTTAGTAPAELHAAALALFRNRRFPPPPRGWNTEALLEIPIRYSLRDSGLR